MLNLQSVAPVLISGFHYEVLAVIASGSPVYDPSDTANPQYLGNVIPYAAMSATSSNC